jgi:transcriptional/translational regulatory protein YebC/TACO1
MSTLSLTSSFLFATDARLIKVAVQQDDETSVQRACKDALKAGVTKTVIDRILNRQRNRGQMEEVLYEGTLPGGVFVLIEALTDKKSRTAPEVRHALSEGGGALGGSATAAWAFDHRALLAFSASDAEGQLQLIEEAMEVEGVEDVIEGSPAVEPPGDFVVEVWTSPSHMSTVRRALLDLGHRPIEEKMLYVPSGGTVVPDDDETHAHLESTLEALKDLDDVEEVWSNLAERP